MAVEREYPYPNQHFSVIISGVTSGNFTVVVLPEMCIDEIKYRTGMDTTSEAQKLPGLTRTNHVVLRRGIIGNLDLYKWIDTVRTGAIDRRVVTINLLSEDLSTIALTWKLLEAWPVKYSFGDLNAQGTEVAVEELVITYRYMQME
jgi:phage tail-like protein